MKREREKESRKKRNFELEEIGMITKTNKTEESGRKNNNTRTWGKGRERKKENGKRID